MIGGGGKWGLLGIEPMPGLADTKAIRLEYREGKEATILKRPGKNTEINNSVLILSFSI